jgi:HlyD family type I secretion membrane fusion protein
VAMLERPQQDSRSLVQADLRRELRRATNYRSPVLFGLFALFLLAGVFGYWAFTAEILGATVATGHFTARGQNRIVQHLEGGIVTEIAFKEGDSVKAGDVLVRLDATQIEAELASLASQADILTAQEARVLAERDGLDTIVYPDALMQRAAANPSIAAYMADQTKEFEAARLRRQTETAILEFKIGSQEAEIAGYDTQNAAGAQQQTLNVEEIASLQGLFDQGLANQQRLTDVKRKSLDLQSEIGRRSSMAESGRQAVQQNQREIQKLSDEVVAQAASDLVDLRVEKAKVINQIVSNNDVLQRSAIRAPVDAVIVDLKVNTIGAVVAQGGEIAELLPQPADLIIEARVQPVDIDRVFVGQQAEIRIPALHIPYSSMIPAKVEYVSADSLVDKDTGEVYYVGRVSDIELPPDIDSKRLAPGMEVEVFFISEPRTFAEYVIDPLWLGLTRSLREE